MSAGAALRAAISDFYGHSMPLVALNAAFWALVLPFLAAALWTPVALAGAALVAGPAGLALMRCAVELVETDELSLRCAPAGLRRQWRRGVLLGALGAAVVAVGLWAVVFYGRAEAWILMAVALYVLVALAAYQLVLWPLAAARAAEPLREVLRAAARSTFARPVQAVVLLLALVLVNAAGAAAALMPLLTLTLAYSALAVARFALTRPVEETG